MNPRDSVVVLFSITLPRMVMLLSPEYAENVLATDEVVGGVQVVRVTVTAPLPVIGLLGPAGGLTVSGRAVKENQ